MPDRPTDGHWADAELLGDRDPGVGSRIAHTPSGVYASQFFVLKVRGERDRSLTILCVYAEASV